MKEPLDTRAKEAKRNKSAVPSVEKALDVIELLAGSTDGLTMNEMVDALARTMGEIYRIVVYLAERGYIEQDAGTSRYALTLRLFELSHRHSPTERLIRKALPRLEKVAEATAQSCHLGVLNHNHVLVLASVPSPRPAGYAVRTGAFFPVDQTSSGHVILAFSKSEEQDHYLANLEPVRRAQVAMRISTIRANGFEDTPSTMVNGVRNLCVPVFDDQGIVAAITSGFIGQANQPVAAEEALSLILENALELSLSLGFRPLDGSLGHGANSRSHESD